MSILSGFKKQKKYITDDNGDHQLISDWTHTDTVMTESGENLTEYLQTHSGVDTKVTQTETTTNADYELLLSGTADSTTRTEGANKSSYATFNPSKKAFTFGKPSYSTTARGSYSVVEGWESHASGSYSHAEGHATIASGDASHSEGVGTIAQRAYQHVFGKHNIADTTGEDETDRGEYIEIVGNGTSNARSNARTLDWDGNETLAGTLTVGAEPTGYMDVATKYYVDSRTTLDINVTQTETGNDVVGDYEILFSESTGNTTLTEGARKTEKFYYNPYHHALTFGTRLANSGTGYGSIALGYDVEASSDGSYAEGVYAHSTGYYSHAENSGTATGHHSHAEGNGTSSGEYAHAEGSGSEASGTYSHAEGLGTTASARKSHAEGEDTEASGEASHAEGLASEASGDYSHAEGDNTIASGYQAHAEGSGTQATGYQAHAEGYSTTASGASSHSEGDGTTAQGDYSHAEGVGSEATLSGAHAEGQDTQATGYYSHSEGNTTLASGWTSHAEGYQTQATGYYAHTEGHNTIASDYASHAEGDGNVASSSQAHAEGYGTTASGIASHSEGESTEASGTNSHAEGQTTTAYGIGSHAEGSGTQATGYYAHSEGDSTVASGDCSHAEGFNTEASGSYQHVEGRYNEIDQNGAYIHIAGNGYVDDQDVVRRSNAYTLDWDGNGWLAGGLTTNGAINTPEIQINDGTDNYTSSISPYVWSISSKREEPLLLLVKKDYNTGLTTGTMELEYNDIIISGDTWDGTNTSLKTAFLNASGLPLAGGTMTGTIITPADSTKGIEPASDIAGRIGSSSKRYNNIYAVNFHGNISNSNSITSAGTTIGKSIETSTNGVTAWYTRTDEEDPSRSESVSISMSANTNTSMAGIIKPDIILNGDTWDGTHTSLKDTITAILARL